MAAWRADASRLHQAVRAGGRDAGAVGRGAPVLRERGAGPGGDAARGSVDAARQGAGAGARGLDRGAGRRLRLPCRRGRQAVQRREPQHDLRGRVAGARPAQLLRPALGAADRHQVDRGRASVAGHVLEADRRAHRRLRRLRRPRPAAAVDAGARRRRGDRAARRLHRQVHEHGGPRRLPSALQGAADLQGQDLGLLRRRRHVRPLLPQGHLRGSDAGRGLPGQVRQGARGAEDLGGLRPGRAVHHRPDGARRSTAPGISARPTRRATSSTSCSSTAPTAACSSTRT